MISYTELNDIANKLITSEEFVQLLEKYVDHNPKHIVNKDEHRRIMGIALNLARNVVDRGGTEDEVKRACLYMQLAIHVRKHQLNLGWARRDLKIEELRKKYSA